MSAITGSSSSANCRALALTDFLSATAPLPARLSAAAPLGFGVAELHTARLGHGEGLLSATGNRLPFGLGHQGHDAGTEHLDWQGGLSRSTILRDRVQNIMKTIDEGAGMGTPSLLIFAKGISPRADFVRAARWSGDPATRHAPTVWTSRKLLRLALFVALGCLAGPALVVPALADQTAAATALSEDPAVTALVAEADAAYAAAADLRGADKRKGLLKVKALIDKIATHYPASQASLAIALGKKVGTVDPMALDAELTALGSNTATTADITAQATAPAADPLSDPLLKLINQCLTAPNLPAAAVGDAKVKLRLQTGADGAVSGMPGLIEPVSPNAPERQLFNRSLLGLGACTELTASQHNTIVEFSVSAQGVVDGSVLQTEVASPPPNTATSSTASTTDPTVIASQPSIDWAPATSQSQDALNLKRKDIAEIQARLIAMSYDPKGIDGSTGAGLRAAVGLWQTSAGIPSTGYLDGPQLDRLKVDSQSAFDVWKANADNSKLLAKSSGAPKTGVRRGHNGWYRAAGGNYCRMGMFGLWCQTWKPVAW